MKSSIKSEIESRLECKFRWLAARAFAGCSCCELSIETDPVARWNSLKASALADIEKIVDKSERELREELADFALEVVVQYGYQIGDGLYATGGASVVESAFSILRQNNMLDSDGNFSTKQLKTPEIEKELEKRRDD